MKLLMIAVYYKENEATMKTLQKEFHLNHVGYFQRGSLKSSLNSAAKAAVQETALDAKQSIDLEESLNGILHVYVRPDGLAATVISDNEYPPQVATNLLNTVMDAFTAIYPATSWANLPKGSGKMTSLSATLKKYQDPNADPLLRLQKEVDETKEVLEETFKKAAERQEDLDELVQNAEKLETVAENMFHKTERAKRKHGFANSCFYPVFRTFIPSFTFNKKY